MGMGRGKNIGGWEAVELNGGGGRREDYRKGMDGGRTE